MTSAAERILSVAAAHPDAVRLATVLSLAARIEPELLREARLMLGLGGSAEADLWWSELVASQNVDGIVLDPAVAEELRGRLASPAWDALRSDAWDLVARRHRDEHDAIRLEERINWLSITTEPNAAEAIEDLLVAAAGEWMVSAEDSFGGVRWMLSAMRRLPPAVRDTPTASVLGAAAAAQVDTRLLDGDAARQPADAFENWFPWLLSRLPMTTVSVALGEGSVDFETPAVEGHELEIPDAEPFVIAVAWNDDEPRRVEARVRRGVPLRIPVNSDTVELTTMGGRRHVLRRSGRPRADGGIDFSAVRVAHRRSAGFEPVARRIVDAVRGFTGWVGVHGARGAGKTTALCAALDMLEAEPNVVVLQHFYGRGAAWQDEPAAVIGSLVAQLRAAVPDLPPPDEASPKSLRSGIGPPGDTLHRLLAVAGERGSQRVVVALDQLPGANFEAVMGWLSRSPFPSIPAASTCIVATSEFAQGIRDWLETGDPYRSVSVDTSDSRAACFAYAAGMHQRLAVAFGGTPDIERLVEMAEGEIGTFQPLVDWLAASPPAAASLDAVPFVLTAEGRQPWLSLDGVARERLPVLAAAFEGFTLGDLLWAVREHGAPHALEIVRWLRDRHMLAEGQALAALPDDMPVGDLVEAFGTVSLALSEPGVADALRDRLGPDEVADGHRWLALVVQVSMPDDGLPSPYLARHALEHAVAGGASDLVARRCEASVVLRTVHRFGLDAAAADLALARTVVANRDIEALQWAVAAVRDRPDGGTVAGLQAARAVAQELAVQVGPELARLHDDPHQALRPLLELAGVRVGDDSDGEPVVAITATAEGEWALLQMGGMLAIRSASGPVQRASIGVFDADVLLSANGSPAVAAGGRVGLFDRDRGGMTWLATPPEAPELSWAVAVGSGLLAAGRDGRMIFWPGASGEGRVLLGHRGPLACAASRPVDYAGRVTKAAIVELVVDGELLTHGLFVGDGLVLASLAGTAGTTLQARWQGADLPATEVHRHRSGVTLLRLELRGHPRVPLAREGPHYADLGGYDVSEQADGTLLLTPRYTGLGSRSARQRAMESGIGRFVFTPSGEVFAVALSVGANGVVRAVPVSALDANMVERFGAETGWPQIPPLSARPAWFLTGSDDGTVAAWAVDSEAPVLRYTRHRGPVTAVGIVGLHAFSASGDGTLRVWSLEDGHDIAVFAPGAPVTAAVSMEGERIAWGTASGGVGVWDPHAEAASIRYAGHTGGVVGLAEDEGRILSWSEDGSFALWERRAEPAWHEHGPPPVRTVLWAGGTEVRVLWGDNRVQTVTKGWRAVATGCLAVSPDDDEIALGIVEGLQMMAVEQNAGARRRVMFDDPPRDCAYVLEPGGRDWSPIGIDERAGICIAAHEDVFAVGAVDGSISVRGEQGAVLRASGSPVLAVAFTPEGRLVTGQEDGVVTMWDWAEASAETQFRQDGPVAHVAASASWVATSDGDQIHVWDALSGEWRATLRGHGESVTGLARATNQVDGTDSRADVLVSCDAIGDVRLWGPEQGLCLETFHLPVPLQTLAAGDRVVAALDAAGRIWTWHIRGLPRLPTEGVEQGPSATRSIELPGGGVRIVTTIEFPVDVEVESVAYDGHRAVRVALDQPEGFWDEIDAAGELVAKPLVRGHRAVELRLEVGPTDGDRVVSRVASGSGLGAGSGSGSGYGSGYGTSSSRSGFGSPGGFGSGSGSGFGTGSESPTARPVIEVSVVAGGSPERRTVRFAVTPEQQQPPS